MNTLNNANVLLVYGELLEYRIPVFSQLGEKCNLTVSHSGKKMTNGNVGFKEIILPKRTIWRFQFQLGLRQLMREGDFETVIFFMDIAWPATVINFLLPPRSVKRVIWGLWRTGRALPDALRVWLAHRASHNLFYSDVAANDFISLGLPRELVSVARNTLRIDKPGRNEKELRDSILVVGSFNPRKRNDVTLAAFENVSKGLDMPLRLVFVGEGSELENIKELAERSGVSDRVVFHPACHDEEKLRSFYDRAICSVSFGQAGLSVLQSFAYGVPFVTSVNAISGGEIENIATSVNGFLVSAGQAELESVLLQLIQNQDLAKKMGHAALDYYQNNASAANMVDSFLDVIQSDRVFNGEV